MICKFTVYALAKYLCKIYDNIDKLVDNNIVLVKVNPNLLIITSCQ